MLWDISGAQDAVYILNLVVRAVHVVITLCELKKEINKPSSNLNKQRILLYYQEKFYWMHDIGNPSSGESKKTATMTFRIDENVLNVLRTESDRGQITLNSLVNQLLKRYVDWDMFEPKVGMIPIAKPIVVELFKKMSKEEITNMAVNIGKDVVHDIALFMKNRMDLESFLSWFETRMASSLTETNHTLQDGYQVYVLKHELGENWSLYHKIILELMFNEIFNMKVDITISSTTIRFKYRS
ncbi:hypothetical protein NMY3_02096 [Candidatus Nitrosocosmicus oleophilus]|jgi:hypothetical protein|uniref:Uncharacterized protein n=1 Tax=Candidatus Nitrosocosmicus oleophilus TaxID=1353260 RepID=A0A654LZ83_9ARCH|nr:hypothetical protein [Candidatus Nitrosocosmicus oleophilus]ALI36297.1 hypothetical protein NMY3_02096 [Candidatus Nitrosocosmicus oleophilus]